MVNGSEDTDLKIVDFGLSKIIGPNETSLDPFGTLVSWFLSQRNISLVICGTRGASTEALWKGGRSLEFRSNFLSFAVTSASLR